jgi:hypothetical protein
MVVEGLIEGVMAALVCVGITCAAVRLIVLALSNRMEF